MKGRRKLPEYFLKIILPVFMIYWIPSVYFLESQKLLVIGSYKSKLKLITHIGIHKHRTNIP